MGARRLLGLIACLAATAAAAGCSIEPYPIAASATEPAAPQFVVERVVTGADGAAWTVRAFAPNRGIAADWERCIDAVAAQWSRRVVDASEGCFGDHRENDYVFACRKHRVVGVWRGDCLASLGDEASQSFTEDTDGDGCAEYWLKRSSGWYMLSTSTGRVVKRQPQAPSSAAR